MRRSQVGNLGIAVLALVNVALWLLFPPENEGRDQYAIQMLSEIFSSTGMVLMACAIVLSLRPRILEPFFGGLDKMYKSHKTAAITGLTLVLCHFLTMPGSGEASLGRILGKIALIGLLLLVALTLAPRIPVIGGYLQFAYHHWRLSHKLVGAFFILGLIHTFQVKNLIQYAEIPAWYWKIAAYGGAAAYVYRIILAPLLGRAHGYTVEAVQKLNPSTLEVTLRPEGREPRQRAGQFAFISFPGDRALAEPHPFTVSSAPGEGRLRFSIKAAGDWTRRLAGALQPGARARVDGCYGMFDYLAGGPRQVWIAGGIGVTPFLSWVRSLDAAPTHSIAFVYAVRAESDALFWEEFAEAAARLERFRAFLNVSSRDGSLTLEKIAAQADGDLAEQHYYLCGPAAMTVSLTAQLRACGVPSRQIHFEEFNFR